MVALAPVSDVASSGGWSVGPQAGGATTNLWQQLVNGLTLHSPTRVRETRHVILWGDDDKRADDGRAIISAGFPRAGQRAEQTRYSELVLKGTDYLAHCTDYGPCWPSRTAWDTALWAANHGNTAADATSSIGQYTDVWVNGVNDTRSGIRRSTAQTRGPWGKDLAYKGGATRKRMSRATQLATMPTLIGNASARATAGVGWSDDDLQARTGSIYQQIAAECRPQSNQGIPVAMIMKHNNGKQTSDPIPAGVTYARILIDAGGETSQFAYDVQTYIGANPYNGDGVAGPATQTWTYNVANVNSLTWSATNGGEVVAAGDAAHKLSVGDEITISGCSVTGFNGTFTVTALGDAGGLNPTTKCRFALVSDPGGTGTNGKIRNRTNYPPQRAARWAKEFFASLNDCDPFFCKITPRPPHDNAGTYTACVEDKYLGAIDPAQSLAGGALDSTYAAQRAVGYNATSPQQAAFEARHEMLCSDDDARAELIAYLDARYGPDGYIWIDTADQGIQNGEQNAWGQGGVKTGIWRGSRGAPLTIRGGGFAAGATVTQPTTHADIPQTILWAFGLTDHHWLGTLGAGTSAPTRDGEPLQALRSNRYFPIWGDYKTGTGSGFLRASDGVLYVVLNDTQSSGKFWNPTTDYELASTDPTSPQLASYLSALHSIQDARFTPGTPDVHAGHTLTSP